MVITLAGLSHLLRFKSGRETELITLCLSCSSSKQDTIFVLGLILWQPTRAVYFFKRKIILHRCLKLKRKWRKWKITSRLFGSQTHFPAFLAFSQVEGEVKRTPSKMDLGTHNYGFWVVFSFSFLIKKWNYLRTGQFDTFAG